MTNFFYDRQIRRYISQIVSVFSYFEVEFGNDDAGNTVYRRVPVKYATNDKMTASILKNNSENTMLSVPVISVYITGLEYQRDRMQDPSFVDKMNIRQKRYNNTTKSFSTDPGNAFTVERHMPVPYSLQYNVDIWTSNTEQKLQLLEQVLVLFNPDFEIQSTDNYIDWTSLSYMQLESVNYSSKTVPAGGDEQLDVATLSFSSPIWISPPAKLKKLGVIESIISTLYNSKGNLSDDILEANNRLGDRVYTTPTGHNLLILNGQATIYPAGGVDPEDDLTEIPVNTTNTPWGPYVSTFSELKNGITQLRLRKDNPDTLSEIVGTVSYHPTDPNVLLFNVDVDTTPANTLPPINAIIDPTRSAPGINGLPMALAGQRYLLLSPINSGKAGDDSFDGADAWKSAGVDLVANTYDIIQYTGSQWMVSWSADTDKQEFITNLTTGIQYKWNGVDWVKSWEGEYPAGQWSLVF
jgi:hypothetical protein